MPPWLDLLVFDDATLSPCPGCHPINDAAANTCSQLRPNRTKLSLSELFPSNLLQCGRHEDGSGVQPIPDISMDNAPEHDEPENVVPEDAALDSPQPSQGDEYVGTIQTLDAHAPPLDADTAMDVDSDVSPSSVQMDVFGLAVQLQRVFSKPSVSDEDHPITFADFAMWLETRNVGLLCTPS